MKIMLVVAVVSLAVVGCIVATPGASIAVRNQCGEPVLMMFSSAPVEEDTLKEIADGEHLTLSSLIDLDTDSPFPTFVLVRSLDRQAGSETVYAPEVLAVAPLWASDADYGVSVEGDACP